MDLCELIDSRRKRRALFFFDFINYVSFSNMCDMKLDRNWSYTCPIQRTISDSESISEKALRCHSDKETNNPRAAEFFHKLPGALEILTGSSAPDIFNMLNFLLYCLFKLLVTYFVCKKLNRVGQDFKRQARRKIEYQTILEKDWKDIWRQEKERERES